MYEKESSTTLYMISLSTCVGIVVVVVVVVCSSSSSSSSRRKKNTE